MAISNYLQKCEYKLGGLKPHIYLIHKDALTVKIKANGVKVSFNHIKKGKDEDDKEILQDMMVIAVNDAMKQIDKETEKMLGAYGSQLNGLF